MQSIDGSALSTSSVKTVGRYRTPESISDSPSAKDTAMPHARIGEALRALVFEREPGVELHQVLDRYYAPDNTHRTDGKTLNRGEFAEMVAHVRNQVTGGTVTVLNEVNDGATYAERHVFHIDLANGTAQDREVAIFGSFAEDGREFLTSLPPDPMVRMLSHSAGTVRPFVDLAKAQFTSLTLPPRSREL